MRWSKSLVIIFLSVTAIMPNAQADGIDVDRRVPLVDQKMLLDPVFNHALTVCYSYKEYIKLAFLSATLGAHSMLQIGNIGVNDGILKYVSTPGFNAAMDICFGDNVNKRALFLGSLFFSDYLGKGASIYLGFLIIRLVRAGLTGTTLLVGGTRAVAPAERIFNAIGISLIFKGDNDTSGQHSRKEVQEIEKEILAQLESSGDLIADEKRQLIEQKAQELLEKYLALPEHELHMSGGRADELLGYLMRVDEIALGINSHQRQ